LKGKYKLKRKQGDFTPKQGDMTQGEDGFFFPTPMFLCIQNCSSNEEPIPNGFHPLIRF